MGSQAGNLEELAEEANIEGLVPPAIEQDARLVDFQEVAERLLALGAAQRGKLDERAHRTLLPTPGNTFSFLSAQGLQTRPYPGKGIFLFF